MKQTNQIKEKQKRGRKEKGFTDDCLDLDPDTLFLEHDSVLSSFREEYEHSTEHRFFN